MNPGVDNELGSGPEIDMVFCGNPVLFQRFAINLVLLPGSSFNNEIVGIDLFY